MDWNLRRARAENIKFQTEPSLWRAHKTTLRLLGYLNHANMGRYREAIMQLQVFGCSTAASAGSVPDHLFTIVFSDFAL